ncbi:hypothetical protein [Mycobacterium lepromatosis]|uniref:hypothetical protein n=1 Tax=Mycobacterium lepromatosis TaxID=480418 RepID=UPI000AC1A283|nr:hypothetical protein [Mycobacterium lepromatosis]
MLLLRRTYSLFLGQLLHDRTANKMVRAVSRIRGAIAIIMLDDIELRISTVGARRGLE